MSERIFHPTGGVHTGVKAVTDEHGRRHFVYRDDAFQGRGMGEHAGEPDNWQSRHGIDIICLPGTPVIAAFDGIVGRDFGPLKNHVSDGPESKFAGNRLTIEGNGNRAYYAHLLRFADGIEPGARVVAGQVIGFSGTAGNIHHLHVAFQSGDTERLLDNARVALAPHSTAIGETAQFTDATKGPISDDYTGDRSDPDNSPAQGAIPYTPVEANATEATTGNAVNLGTGMERGTSNNTGAVPVPTTPEAKPAEIVNGAAPDAGIPQPGNAPIQVGASADMGTPLSMITTAPPDAGASVEPERLDAGYLIPPPGGLTGGEWFDPVKAGTDLLRIESQVVNLVPYIGAAKGLLEAWTGSDAMTGDQLGAVDRAINVLPVVGMLLKEIVATAKAEQLAAKAAESGTEAFSSAMREIAIKSGDADLLVDSLLIRLEALKEIKDGTQAAELADTIDGINKLFEAVDTMSDVAETICALNAAMTTNTIPGPKQDALGTWVPVAGAGFAVGASTGVAADTPSSAPASHQGISIDPAVIETLRDANLSDPSGIEVHVDGIGDVVIDDATAVNEAPATADVSSRFDGDASMSVRGDGLDLSGFVDIAPILPSEVLTFTPIDVGLPPIDVASIAGIGADPLSSALDAGIQGFAEIGALASFDVTGAAPDGGLSAIDTGHIPDVGQAGGLIDASNISVDVAMDPGLAQSFDPGPMFSDMGGFHAPVFVDPGQNAGGDSF